MSKTPEYFKALAEKESTDAFEDGELSAYARLKPQMDLMMKTLKKWIDQTGDCKCEICMESRAVISAIQVS